MTIFSYCGTLAHLVLVSPKGVTVSKDDCMGSAVGPDGVGARPTSSLAGMNAWRRHHRCTLHLEKFSGGCIARFAVEVIAAAYLLNARKEGWKGPPSFGGALLISKCIIRQGKSRGRVSSLNDF